MIDKTEIRAHNSPLFLTVLIQYVMGTYLSCFMEGMPFIASLTMAAVMGFASEYSFLCDEVSCR
jgi:hypothetical protein